MASGSEALLCMQHTLSRGSVCDLADCGAPAGVCKVARSGLQCGRVCI